MFLYVDLVLSMGFAWMISGITMLVINKKDHFTATIYGICIILVFALTLVDNFLKPNMLNPIVVKYIYIFSRNSYFLIGPSIWLYTRTLLVDKSPNWSVIILHLLPFILWTLSFMVFSSDMNLTPGLHPPKIAPHKFKPSISFLRDLMSILSRLIYSTFILIKILKRSRTVKNFYSNLNIRNTLSWLFYLVSIYTLLFLLDGISLFFPTGNIALKEFISMVVRILPSILFIFLFSLFAMNQNVPEDSSQKQSKSNKYKKSGLSVTESKKLFNRVKDVLTEEKLYLDPEFNLDILAENIGYSRHKISEVINTESSDNFYGFINSFRLDEFMHVIKIKKFPDYTILAIAFECGFKSTSAFYSFFKKVLGVTPKQYISQN